MFAMHWKCNACRHEWDEPLPEDATAVMCEVCGEPIEVSTPPDSAPTLHPHPPTPPPDTEPTITDAPDSAPGVSGVRLEEERQDKRAKSRDRNREEAAPASDPHASLIGRQVDGHRIEKLLGAGGMGAVYLAHQHSLDRKVAMKVLPSRFARNPELLSRFTREALSAAQLNHHNIVQVFDVGADADLNYITMEYVRGESLADMIKRDGRLQLDDAAGFILQAARGLEYAHQRGIIHRDIKPANLMLNEHGIVKIADMGLAKVVREAEKTLVVDETDLAEGPASNPELTRADVAMGTPAYMSPEQARDAASVDARADQYSLGCTLYYLCAGTAPYKGTTAFELISKHLNEPLTPLDVHVRNVPPAFRRIVERMLEKNPDNRYATLGELIKDLEAYLGYDAEAGPYKPREQHLALLEAEQQRYYAAPSMKKQRLAVSGFFGAMTALFFFSLLALQNFTLAGGLLGLTLLTPAAHFILDGILNKTYFFRRVRSVFFGMPLKSWAMTLGGAVLGVGALAVLGWLGYWLGFALVAIGLAVAYEWGIKRRLRQERAGPIETVQQMLKEMRLKGLPEEAIQNFVCRFSGERWEEFFEDLFGYEAMTTARGKWAAADKVKPRKKAAVWREPLARWLDAIEEERKAAREKKQLSKVEARRLEARGVDEKEAHRQAAEAATRIIAEERDKKRRERERVQQELPVVVERRRRLPIGMAFRLAKGACGLAILGAFAYGVVPDYLPLPEGLANFIVEKYYAWGFGGNVVGAVAGLVTLLTAFSRRTFMTTLSLLGAGLLLFLHPIAAMADQPQFNAFTGFVMGAGLLALGIVPSIFAKLTGGRF